MMNLIKRVVRNFPRNIDDLTLFFRRGEQIRRLQNLVDEKNDQLKSKTFIRQNSIVGEQALHQMLKFVKNCNVDADILKSDVFVAHEVMPLLGCKFLAKKFNSEMFCNVVEVPSFRERAVKVNWDESVLFTVEQIVSNCLKECDQLITIGETLGNEIVSFGVPVNVIPNYKYSETIKKNNVLRDRVGLKEGEKLVIAVSTIASDFETILEAFQQLPTDVHLATVGKFSPREYESQIQRLILDLGLEKRVHLLEPVPYGNLTDFISSADIGLIIRDTGIKNNYVSLPNRVFDYINAEIPIVSPYIIDISEIIDKYDIGASIADTSLVNWINSINQVLANKKKHKENCKLAASYLTWASLEPKIEQLFSEYSSVTFLGIGNLAKNQRTLRFAKTLLNQGKKVRIYCFGEIKDITFKHENLEYIFYNR